MKSVESILSEFSGMGCEIYLNKYGYSDKFELQVEFEKDEDKIKVKRRGNNILALANEVYEAFHKLAGTGISLPLLSAPEKEQADKAEYTEFVEEEYVNHQNHPDYVDETKEDVWRDLHEVDMKGRK